MNSETVGIVVGPAGSIVLFFLGLLVYFLPSLLGHSKRNAGAIFVLNLFLGWTFIGWVVALVWACCKDARTPPAPAADPYPVNIDPHTGLAIRNEIPPPPR